MGTLRDVPQDVYQLYVRGRQSGDYVSRRTTRLQHELPQGQDCYLCSNQQSVTQFTVWSVIPIIAVYIESPARFYTNINVKETDFIYKVL